MTSFFMAQFPSIDTTSHTYASLKFSALILCIMRAENVFPSKKGYKIYEVAALVFLVLLE